MEVVSMIVYIDIFSCCDFLLLEHIMMDLGFIRDAWLSIFVTGIDDFLWI
jgi:hypothetical protein